MNTPDNPFEPPISHVSANQKMSGVKKFALAVFASMIGSALVVFLILAIATIPELISSSRVSPPEWDEVENPDGLRMVQHAKVKNTRLFTVQGVIENQSASEWRTVSMEVTFRVAGKKFNKCEGMIFGEVVPKTRHAFHIECENTPGTDLPEGTSYSISILSARRKNKA